MLYKIFIFIILLMNANIKIFFKKSNLFFVIFDEIS